MISQKEMLEIICTEAVEYGGVQEVPGQKHGSKQSYHNPKRSGRTSEHAGDRSDPHSVVLHYALRLVREEDGKLHWED